MIDLVENSKKVSFKTTEGIFLCKAEEILYFQIKSNRTKASLKNGKSFSFSKPLKELETIYGSKDFVRVHQSYLVNKNYINQLLIKSPSCVVVENDIRIPISRRGKKHIKKIFSNS